jgi:hypothetical protein
MFVLKKYMRIHIVMHFYICQFSIMSNLVSYLFKLKKCNKNLSRNTVLHYKYPKVQLNKSEAISKILSYF